MKNFFSMLYGVVLIFYLQFWNMEKVFEFFSTLKHLFGFLLLLFFVENRKLDGNHKWERKVSNRIIRGLDNETCETFEIFVSLSSFFSLSVRANARVCPCVSKEVFANHNQIPAISILQKNGWKKICTTFL